MQIYTTLYRIVRHMSNEPFPFLLRSFNSEKNFFLPVAPTFPNFPVFISSFASRYFEVCELTFVPLGLCANSLLLTSVIYSISFYIQSLILSQSNHLQFLSQFFPSSDLVQVC